MDSTDPRLERLALQVAEGTAIDWDQAERAFEDSQERVLVRELRALAELSDVHRTLQRTPSTAASAVDLEETLPAETPRYWGDFEILEKVGEGSFGEVFRARDRILDREVALKLLRLDGRTDPERARAVLREGRLMARVKHPNVATIHGADECDGRVGLWMEFVEGQTLSRIVKEQGPFSVEETIQIGIDLCAAVQAVHDAGILHRDIKAQNVMREPGGRIVLMDFGVGRDRARTRRDDKSLSGTPLYLAPEVLDGGEASVRSDIYSVGVVLFHLLSSQFPIGGHSIGSLRQAHEQRRCQGLADICPKIPATLTDVIERALTRDPKSRPTLFELTTAVQEKRPDQSIKKLSRLTKPVSNVKTTGTDVLRTSLVSLLLLLFILLWLIQTRLRDHDEPAPGTGQVTAQREEAREAFLDGRAHHEKGDLRGAIERYRRATSLNPNLAIAWNNLAICQSGINQVHQALESSARSFALRKNASEQDRNWIDANYYHIRLQYRKAIPKLEYLVQNHQHAKAARILGQVRAKLPGARDEALRDLAVAVELDPIDSINRGQYAILLAMTKGTRDALLSLDSVPADAVSPYLKWARGYAHMVAGDWERATRAFQELSETDATYSSNADIFLSRILVAQGFILEAIELLTPGHTTDRAQEFIANELRRTIFLAQLYLLIGERAAAFDELETLLSLERVPAYLPFLRDGGVLLARNGHLEEASILLASIDMIGKRFPSQISTAFAHQVRAEVNLSSGDYEQALDHAREALRNWADWSVLDTFAEIALCTGSLVTARQGSKQLAALEPEILNEALPILWITNALRLASIERVLVSDHEAMAGVRSRLDHYWSPTKTKHFAVNLARQSMCWDPTSLRTTPSGDPTLQSTKDFPGQN